MSQSALCSAAPALLPEPATTDAANFQTQFADIFPDITAAPERFVASKKLWHRFVEGGFLTRTTAGVPKGERARLCDVGAADGSLTNYLAKAFDYEPRAYDVVTPEHNLYTVGKTMTNVSLFDGQSIPEADRGCDLMLFAYVLHHAANNTFALLQEAVRATRGYVLVAEDLADPLDAERTARNLLHDKHGIFRTVSEWEALLPAMGLDILERGRLFGDSSPQAYFIAAPVQAEIRTSPS